MAIHFFDDFISFLLFEKKGNVDHVLQFSEGNEESGIQMRDASRTRCVRARAEGHFEPSFRQQHEPIELCV